MPKTVDIKNAKVEYLNLITDTEARDIIQKGWSLSFVYSFRETRDVFLAFRRYGQKDLSVAEFSNKYVKDKIPFEKKPWDTKGRRVLEIKNALINYGLIEKDTLVCRTDVFDEVEPGAPLSENDLMVFREIFFHYFRFQEYSSLFISPAMDIKEKLTLTEDSIIKGSRVLFYFSSKGGRVDSFFYELNNPNKIYQFPRSVEKEGNAKGGYLRFWDVFLTWAKQLNLIARLNMKTQNVLLSNGETFRACYFINPCCIVNVPKVINDKYNHQLLIDIADLVMEICIRFRCSVVNAQQSVLDFYLAHPERVSLIRTSEIFIKMHEVNERDRILYPKYKGSYISHIKLRGYE